MFRVPHTIFLLLLGVCTLSVSAAQADSLIVFKSIIDGDIYSMSGMGNFATHERRLTHSSSYKSSPKLSPDGSQVIFVAGKDKDHADIFSMKSDGSNLRILTNGKGYSSQPNFSPDGSKIVFVSNGAICSMNAAGKQLKRLSDNVDSSLPIFSHDGSKILFVGRKNYYSIYRLCVIDADGTNPVYPLDKSSASISNEQQPQFSPDDSTIIFVDGIGSSTQQLSSVNLATLTYTNLTHFTDSDTEIFNPVFSPNGSQLAFDYWYPDFEDADENGFYPIISKVATMDARGGAVHLLSYRYASIEEAPPNTVCYSPDGTRLLFDAGWLYTAKVNGSGYQGPTEGMDGFWGNAPANPTPPVNVSLTPTTANSPGAQVKNFTSVQSDPDGASNIEQSLLLVNVGGTTKGGILARYDGTTNLLYLRDEDDTRWLGGYTVGSSNVISTHYGRLDCSRTRVARKGNSLIISWAIVPRLIVLPGQSRALDLYLSAFDSFEAVTSGRMATWTVTSPSLMNISAQTTYGGLPTGSDNTLTIQVQNSAGAGKEKITFIVNATASPVGALAGVIDVGTRTVSLYDDRGRTLSKPIAFGTRGAVVGNSQGTLDIGCSRLSFNRKTITASLVLRASSKFIGYKTIYLLTRTASQSTPIEAFGTWYIYNYASSSRDAPSNLVVPSSPES